jgi:FkbM family methyltransferase
MSRITRWLRSHKLIPSRNFGHLRYVSSGRLCTEKIGGKDFRIADGPTFCASYREIFVDELYRFRAATPAPRIVDCGANCGVSVLYFKTLYPQAKIVAVEADPQIFRTLEWNVAQRGWSDVTLVNKAVAAGSGTVTFHCQGADSGRIHPLDSAIETCSVPVVELDELLDEPTDLLKIDIEGAEAAAIAACQRLEAVSNLFVEYHSFADTAQSLHTILEKLAANGFRYYLQNQFCARRPLVDDECHLGMDLQVNVFAKRVGRGR